MTIDNIDFNTNDVYHILKNYEDKDIISIEEFEDIDKINNETTCIRIHSNRTHDTLDKLGLLKNIKKIYYPTNCHISNCEPDIIYTSSILKYLESRKYFYGKTALSEQLFANNEDEYIYYNISVTSLLNATESSTVIINKSYITSDKEDIKKILKIGHKLYKYDDKATNHNDAFELVKINEDEKTKNIKNKIESCLSIISTQQDELKKLHQSLEDIKKELSE